uniref:Phosphatidylserine synthase n=1 Tax=Sarcoptes scabiei TaxID=52283 RepID=A0A834RB05_SARSC
MTSLKPNFLFALNSNIIRYEEVEEKKEFPTAHDWRSYKTQEVFDDGTQTFFWRAHTLTVLFFMVVGLIYVSLFEEPVSDSNYNIKRGLIAVVLVFILFGITQIPDGPFIRPHPALWRLVLCLTIIYELSLIYILFQTPNDARQLLSHIDPSLGKQLTEKNYGSNCRIYDHENPSDPFHNIKDKFDVFVPTHFFGWWLKTLMIRDWWLCTVISIMFELLEYTLEHQLPNFSECWWDHWILDALLCNGLGIYFGMVSLKYLYMKPYNWRGLWNIPTYRGKLKRIVAQFGPHSWIQFDWRPFSSFDRWISTMFIIMMMLVAELNTFYLKYVLWLDAPHVLNLMRLILLVFSGAVALRETFQYLDDPTCTKFGRQSWVLIAVIITELLIILKFDYNVITKPLPQHIFYLWIGAFMILVAWTIWRFLLKNTIQIFYNSKKKKIKEKKSLNKKSQ